MPSASITVPSNCNSVASSTAQFSSNIGPVFVTSNSVPITPGNSTAMTPPSIVQLISMPALFNRIPVLPYSNQLTSLAVQSNFNPELVTSNSLPNMSANNTALTSHSVNQLNRNTSTMFTRKFSNAAYKSIDVTDSNSPIEHTSRSSDVRPEH